MKVSLSLQTPPFFRRPHTHVEVLGVHAGPALQQDVGRSHVSRQHGAMQRRVPVHAVHGAQGGVVLHQEPGGFWPGTQAQEERSFPLFSGCFSLLSSVCFSPDHLQSC